MKPKLMIDTLSPAARKLYLRFVQSASEGPKISHNKLVQEFIKKRVPLSRDTDLINSLGSVGLKIKKAYTKEAQVSGKALGMALGVPAAGLGLYGLYQALKPKSMWEKFTDQISEYAPTAASVLSEAGNFMPQNMGAYNFHAQQPGSMGMSSPISMPMPASPSVGYSPGQISPDVGLATTAANYIPDQLAQQQFMYGV